MFWDGLSVPSLRVFFDCLSLEDERDRLSQNVGKQLPHHAACHSLREKASVRQRWKSEISHNKQEFTGMRKSSAKLRWRFIHFSNEECALSSRIEILSEVLCSYWYSKTLRIYLRQASISGGYTYLNIKVAIFVINSYSTLDWAAEFVTERDSSNDVYWQLFTLFSENGLSGFRGIEWSPYLTLCCWKTPTEKVTFEEDHCLLVGR